MNQTCECSFCGKTAKWETKRIYNLISTEPPKGWRFPGTNLGFCSNLCRNYHDQLEIKTKKFKDRLRTKYLREMRNGIV